MTASDAPSVIGKLVIAGRDAAAWLAATALMRAFGPTGLKIEVVELPTFLRGHDVCVSQPALEAFHRLLGFDEYEVLKACAGSYSLGQSFANFSGPRPPFLHPYGSHGRNIGRVPFHQVWLKARQSGMNVPFENFSLTAVAAQQGRFFTTTTEIESFARCDYAYHLDAQAYVQYLKAHALRLGVTVTPARRLTANLSDDGGAIRSLTLGDGRVVDGDLFIDATGAESLLLGQALGVGIDTWAAWFPFDRVMTAAGPRLRTLPSYGQTRALEIACLHLTPTQGQTGATYAYRSVISDDEAFRDMTVAAGLHLRPDATVSPLAAGRRHKAWSGNCIALGEAACLLDPIDNGGLHIIQLGLAHLITLFPLDSQCQIEATDYNLTLQSALERFRDYQIVHYKLNQLRDMPLWDQMRDQAPPPLLAHKLDLFAARGIVPLYDNETFQLDDWLASFIGHGLIPQAYDPLIDLTPQDEAIRSVQGMLGFIRQHVEDMSSLEAYIELFAARDFA